MSKNIDEIYSKWADYLRFKKIIPKVSKIFKNADTTQSERVISAKKYLAEANLLPDFQRSVKSNELSIKFREQGNQKFAHKRLCSAFELYNKAIAYAENDNSECLATAYANRSAVLYQLGYYDECESDIETALLLNYPAEKRSKLQARLDKSKSSTNRKKHQFYLETVNVPAENRHEAIPCACNNIKISYIKDLGRHVIATKDLKPGDLIAVEEPYVSALIPKRWYTNCNYCVEQKLNLIPCDKCPFAMFCSKLCKQKAFEQYHKYECDLYNQIVALELPKAAQISLRITLTARNEYSRIADILNEEKLDEFFPDYFGIHFLVTHKDKIPVNEICRKSVVAALILHLLEQTSFFTDLDNPDGITIASDLLLRHLETCDANFHQITVAQPFSNMQNEAEQLANGAYPFASMFNHSCAPNVFRSLTGRTNIIRALRPISAGQELLETYGPHHALSTRTKRQQELRDQYYFDCQCEACVNDWPLWFDLGNSRVGAENPDLEILSQGIFQKKNIYLPDIINQLSLRNVESVKKAIPEIVKHLIYLETSRPCAAMCEYQECFKEYFFLHGNLFQIYDEK